MGVLIQFILLVVLGIGIAILSIRIIYRKIKVSRHPRTVTFIISFLILLFSNIIFFEDELFFSKEDAKYFLEEQEIELIDEFKFDDIRNMSNIFEGSTGGAFSILLSERDKKNIISQIKKSNNFNSRDRQENYPIVNYEIDGSFYQEVVGRNGGIIIKILKGRNALFVTKYGLQQ